MHVSVLQTWMEAKKRPPSTPKKEFPKGVCPHCKKHIGRGIYRHTKACAK